MKATRLTRACTSVVAVLLATVVGASTAQAVGVAHDRVVSATPDSRTPRILDGAMVADDKVLDIAEVGDRIVVSGEFDTVQDVSANGGRTFTRRYVFAFDPATGAVDRAFAPDVNGIVRTVTAGPDGTVYLGGTFTSVNGELRRNLAQVSLATGATTSFRTGGINGAVADLKLSGGRLFVGGFFNRVDSAPHGGLATVDPRTGAVDEYLGIDVSINHNWPTGTARGAVGVRKFDISPDGTRLVAIGNFKRADGEIRDQVLMAVLDPAGARLDLDWRARGYEPACAYNSFDYYVRDLSFSPDGSWFVIVTTGAKYAGTLCDTAARFATADRGQDVRPVWFAETGGDTFFSVAATQDSVFFGGHMRWMNNPSGHDHAGPGAVPRPGLGALDARTGMPLSWNPGRHPRGIGAEALLLTERGLYVGSDTEYIGNRQYKRPRLAFFPLEGGLERPDERVTGLPGNIYLGGPLFGPSTQRDALLTRPFTGTKAGTDSSAPNGGLAWRNVRGAFLTGKTLYYNYRSGTGTMLYRRSFDGTTFGPAEAVDPYNDPLWSDVSTGSRNLYRGVRPNFYSQLSGVLAMAYSEGRLYYTRTGSSRLHYRYFSPDSGVVHPTEMTASAGGFVDVSGIIMTGGKTYLANARNGHLYEVSWNASGVTKSTVVSGPTRDGRDWRAKGVFLGPGGNTAPTAVATAACTGLDCAFDAAGSTDADGRVAAYAWSFGDGASGTGVTPRHTYAAAGTYTATLTVTDNEGATSSTTTTVTVAPVVNQPPTAAFATTCADLVCAFDASGSTDVDGQVVSYAWDLGDGTTATGPTVEHTYTTPGDRTVRLVVTDDAGATDEESALLTVTAPPPSEGIGLRGSAGTSARTVTEVSVTVPDTVRPGDGLVLVLSTNSAAVSATVPDGWTLAGEQTTTTAMRVQVLTRVAGLGDAGSTLTLPLSGITKVTAQLMAYSGTAATGPVTTVTGASAGSGTAHTTPAASAPAGSWVLSVWSDKSPSERVWSPPTTGITERSNLAGIGTGDIATLLVDSGAAVPGGEVGGLTATVSASSTRATTLTVVLAPKG